MIYPIHIYGSPALRKATEEVTTEYPGLHDLIRDMFETMYYSNGIGLAAPQIGRSIRLFVIDLEPYGEDDPTLKDFKRVFINPEIYKRCEDEQTAGEGCLSVPGMNEEVSRPTRINVRYMDENMVEHDQEFTGFAARVIQHEYDHLDGKMFVDRLVPLRKALLRSKLNAMSKGKYVAEYKTIQLR